MSKKDAPLALANANMRIIANLHRILLNKFPELANDVEGFRQAAILESTTLSAHSTTPNESLAKEIADIVLQMYANILKNYADDTIHFARAKESSRNAN